LHAVDGDHGIEGAVGPGHRLRARVRQRDPAVLHRDAVATPRLLDHGGGRVNAAHPDLRQALEEQSDADAGPEAHGEHLGPCPRASSSTAARSMSRFIRAMTAPATRPAVRSKPLFGVRTPALKHLK
jgi:hypothetical protein